MFCNYSGQSSGVQGSGLATLGIWGTGAYKSEKMGSKLAKRLYSSPFSLCAMVLPIALQKRGASLLKNVAEPACDEHLRVYGLALERSKSFFFIRALNNLVLL
jgi:hypothetical protein